MAPNGDYNHFLYDGEKGLPFSARNGEHWHRYLCGDSWMAWAEGHAFHTPDGCRMNTPGGGAYPFPANTVALLAGNSFMLQVANALIAQYRPLISVGVVGVQQAQQQLRLESLPPGFSSRNSNP